MWQERQLLQYWQIKPAIDIDLGRVNTVLLAKIFELSRGICDTRGYNAVAGTQIQSGLLDSIVTNGMNNFAYLSHYGGDSVGGECLLINPRVSETGSWKIRLEGCGSVANGIPAYCHRPGIFRLESTIYRLGDREVDQTTRVVVAGVSDAIDHECQHLRGKTMLDGETVVSIEQIPVDFPNTTDNLLTRKNGNFVIIDRYSDVVRKFEVRGRSLW